jgi:hypothetical protein
LGFGVGLFFRLSGFSSHSGRLIHGCIMPNGYSSFSFVPLGFAQKMLRNCLGTALAFAQAIPLAEGFASLIALVLTNLFSSSARNALSIPLKWHDPRHGKVLCQIRGLPGFDPR